MARKGIAVSQIILLVLGILVLAVVAYLLYTNFVQTGATISAETCRAEATRICTGCVLANQPSATCQYQDKITPIGSTTQVDSNMEKCVSEGKVAGNVGGNTIDCRLLTGGGTGGGVTPTPPPPPTPIPTPTPTSLACNTCDKLNVGGTTGWTATLGGTGCQNPSSGATQTCPP